MTPPIQEPGAGLNAAVAAELRAEQGRARLSVQALSEQADVPYGSLRRYLAAERHIDVSVLFALCLALEVDPGDLVARAAQRIHRADVTWPADTEVEMADDLVGPRNRRNSVGVADEAARNEDNDR